MKIEIITKTDRWAEGILRGNGFSYTFEVLQYYQTFKYNIPWEERCKKFYALKRVLQNHLGRMEIKE